MWALCESFFAVLFQGEVDSMGKNNLTNSHNLPASPFLCGEEWGGRQKNQERPLFRLSVEIFYGQIGGLIMPI